MGEGAPAGGLRVFQSKHSYQQGRRLFDMPWTRRRDAADVPGQFAADGVVLGLSPQHGKGFAAAGQGLRHGVAAAGESGRAWQTVPCGAQYSEHDRADQLLDVPSLADGMSDHEHKPDVDNPPPTAAERELRDYPLDLT